MIPSCLSCIRAAKVLRVHIFTGKFLFLLGKHCFGNKMATTTFSETAKDYFFHALKRLYKEIGLGHVYYEVALLHSLSVYLSKHFS